MPSLMCVCDERDRDRAVADDDDAEAEHDAHPEREGDHGCPASHAMIARSATTPDAPSSLGTTRILVFATSV